MNAVEMAQAAYGSIRAPIRTPRSTEYEAIARITRRLKKASQNKKDYSEFATALHENRRLWTLLGVNIVEPGNALPDELRARLGYLADFCVQHTSKVLKGEASADILVDINLSVLGGLRAPGAEK